MANGLMTAKRAALLCANLLLWAAATFGASAAPDQPVGQRFNLRADTLPEPRATPSVINPPRRVRRDERQFPAVPPGFRVNIFAQSLVTPRWMVVVGNGDVLVTESSRGRIILLRDRNRDGKADERHVFAGGFAQPHGLALQPSYLYVADTRAVWRLGYRPGQIVVKQKPRQITKSGALGDSQGHWTRNVIFSPDGQYMYVAIGSRSNLAEDPLPRATVQRFRTGGREQITFASGLRNPVGIAFYPRTNKLYVAVNERDGLGDELVPDYLTRVEEGDFYGWPYAYLGPRPDPEFGSKRPDLVASARAPDLLFRSHSAPLGLVFYSGGQFPDDYNGDAFVALHGSWNARRPRGYMVVRVPFRDGQPVGYYESFMTGFWTRGEDRASVWGRPAGLAVADDGSLLVADDTGGIIWRVSYDP